MDDKVRALLMRDQQGNPPTTAATLPDRSWGYHS